MYTEVVATRKNNPLLKVLQITAGVLAIVCLLLGFLLLPQAFIAAAIFAVLYWLIGQNTNLEFQYFHMDDEMDIDKVIGNSKRKHIATVKMGQVILLAPLGTPELSHYDSLPTLDVSSKDPDSKPYVMICPVNGQKKRVLLQMNDALLKSLKRQLGSAKVL